MVSFVRRFFISTYLCENYDFFTAARAANEQQLDFGGTLVDGSRASRDLIQTADRYHINHLPKCLKYGAVACTVRDVRETTVVMEGGTEYPKSPRTTVQVRTVYMHLFVYSVLRLSNC